MIVFAPPMTRIKVKQVMYSQEIDLPFTAIITFSDRRTQEKIKTIEAEGYITGVTVQKFEVQIDEESLTANIRQN